MLSLWSQRRREATVNLFAAHGENQNRSFNRAPSTPRFYPVSARGSRSPPEYPLQRRAMSRISVLYWTPDFSRISIDGNDDRQARQNPIRCFRHLGGKMIRGRFAKTMTERVRS